MNRRIAGLVVGFVVAGVVSAHAQATFMPSFSAPYRAFEKSEFGAVLSFPGGSVTGIEGFYRVGYKQFDFGARGGIASGNSNTEVLLGVEGRVGVIEQKESFPLDGAVIVGFGTVGFDNWNIPAGLSIGRVINIEDSDISLTPYVQPTVMLGFLEGGAGTRTTEFGFSLGLGLDVKLSSQFDARLSVGVGDVEGFSIAAVWVR